MALRLAFDLDGTLADMNSALQREAARLFGPGVMLRPGDVPVRADDEGSRDAGQPPDKTADPTRRPLTRAEIRRLWAHVRTIENFWTGLDEIEPGAVGRVAALAARHGWEVLFLTQRPATAGHTAQVQSQRWLAKHGFDFPSVYVMNGSRGRVADALALDAVIDDRADNCLDVAIDSKARALLVWRDESASVPPSATRLGIETVYSIAEALDVLQQMTVRAHRGDGLVGRLRAAIGI